MIKPCAILLTLLTLALPVSVQACPSCQDAIAACPLTEDDPLRAARAYNRSIYLMAGMPYLLLGIISYKIYRGFKNAPPRDPLN